MNMNDQKSPHLKPIRKNHQRSDPKIPNNSKALKTQMPKVNQNSKAPDNYENFFPKLDAVSVNSIDYIKQTSKEFSDNCVAHLNDDLTNKRNWSANSGEIKIDVSVRNKKIEEVKLHVARVPNRRVADCLMENIKQINLRETAIDQKGSLYFTLICDLNYKERTLLTPKVQKSAKKCKKVQY